MTEPTPKKLATLNPTEDRAWGSYFSYYKDNGKTDDEADRLTWIDLSREFPRLTDYDGCLP